MIRPTVLAASEAVADVAAGPARPGEVIHRAGPAAYLRLDEDGRIVAIETASGVGLPIAVRVDAVGGIDVGDRIELGGRPPRRWWSADAPTIAPTTASVEAFRSALGLRRSVDPDPMERRLVDADPVGRPHEAVGLGPGLTPAGDDLVAGALVTLRALGMDERADRVAAAIDPGRTTPISAALLVEAGRGRAARPLLRLLGHLDRPVDPGPALDGLLSVGASSGRWLARGVLAALAQL